MILHGGWGGGGGRPLNLELPPMDLMSGKAKGKTTKEEKGNQFKSRQPKLSRITLQPWFKTQFQGTGFPVGKKRVRESGSAGSHGLGLGKYRTSTTAPTATSH